MEKQIQASADGGLLLLANLRTVSIQANDR